MAVTITVTELLAAIRLGDSPEELAETTRLLAYCDAAITKHVPTAHQTPYTTKRCAVLRVNSLTSRKLQGVTPLLTRCGILVHPVSCYPIACIVRV